MEKKTSIKTNRGRMLSIMCVLALAAACKKSEAPVTPGGDSDIESVTVTPDKLSLYREGTARLEFSVLPAEAEYSEVKWESLDAGVATVDQNGNIQAVSPGKTTVNVTVDGVSGSAEITVCFGDKKPENANIGDFYLSDGSILSQQNDAETVRAADVIGVVFSTDTGRMGEDEKKYLEAKGIKPHGLVVSCKFSDKMRRWYANPQTGDFARDEKEVGIPNVKGSDHYETFKLADADIDGFKYTRAIREIRQADYENGFYPAFKAAEYLESENPAPETSTGWYLPANGQWFDILRGIGSLELDSGSDFYAESTDFYWWYKKSPIVTRINSIMEKIDPEDKSVFLKEGMMFWTSTPSTVTDARFVQMDDNGFVCCYYYYKFAENYTLYILGF